MKKNILNDKVIRAMAIGISAMLATATPMSVMAADGVDDPEGGNPNEAEQTTKPASDVCDAAQEAADAAQEAVDAAQGSAETVIKDVKENVVAGEAGKDNEGKDLAKEVIDAAADTEEDTSLKDAKTAIENTDTQLGIAETNDGLSDSTLDKAENAVKEADEIATDMKDAMNEANATADQQVQNIENATTVADANAAYDELAATAEQAQKDFEAKLADYDKAKAAYDEAAAKVKEYEDAYNDAIAKAETNAEAAKAELEAAQKNAAALEEAVSAAKEAVDASAANAIVEAEKLTQTDGTLNWKNEDTLFAAIMTNYYLPEELGIKGATVKRVQGKDNNEYNYFEVTYVENGETKVKYFNYKMDGNSTDDIVIFEKRDVEVNGGAYDQYVDDNDKAVDTVAGVENGTVVKVGDEFVVKNELTGSDTLVSNSEITGTSKVDVTINESTKQESYQLDEDGNLVKTVTADVTTVTYTDATFTSDQFFATDAERNAAAKATKAELEAATGKDATIKETENTTYTGTATYIPTFTKTVNVKNEEVESGRIDWLREADSDAEAVAIVKEEQEKALRDDIEDDDLYCINVKSDLSVTGHTKDKWYDDSDYLVSGTVTATYAKVTKQTVDQSTFGSLWDDIKTLISGGQSTNEKLEAAAKAAVEADGGIFISADWVDWRFNKATIRYVAASKVETNEMGTAQEAEKAVQNALAQANANYNVKTKTIANTTYSYTVGYLQKSSENTENKAIATETYGNADVLEGQIIQNKNYYDTINGIANNILLTQKDEDYRTFVDDAKAITGKYDRLLTEAKAANDAVLAAQEQVKTLQNEIKALKEKSNNVADLTELTAKLDSAKANRDAAEKTLNEILQKLEGAGVTRDEVIASLTPPAPTGGDGGETGGETGGTPSGTTTVTGTPVTTAAVQGTGVTATVATTTVAGGAVAQTGAAAGGAAVAVAAAGNQEEVTIADEQTPLAVNTEENNEEDTTVISDEETPLAAEAMEEKAQQEKMSWWWLLIVAILGATGYEMYRKHQEKKKAAVETKSEK